MAGVYQIYNTETGKRYIGSSIDVERRLKEHKRNLKSHYLQFATPGQYTKWFNKIPLLGTYPIVNKQFQNYEEDKDKARKQR